MATKKVIVNKSAEEIEKDFLHEKAEQLFKEVELLKTEVNRLSAENKSLVHQLNDLSVSEDLSSDYVILYGEKFEIAHINLAKHIDDQVKKRFISDGQTCVVLHRDAPIK